MKGIQLSNNLALARPSTHLQFSLGSYPHSTSSSRHCSASPTAFGAVKEPHFSHQVHPPLWHMNYSVMLFLTGLISTEIRQGLLVSGGHLNERLTLVWVWFVIHGSGDSDCGVKALSAIKLKWLMMSHLGPDLSFGRLSQLGLGGHEWASLFLERNGPLFGCLG
ncbi:hypothetical protein DY000_02024292 [Brassica cretica]|uniref:Uncharacterized protein n=1 Tax=Brassica cretica TaxID=69181 RepID=A0ABQ7EH82_BRACR|nr:hypothetical protein DY000_02024292 [Brassica cretica]